MHYIYIGLYHDMASYNCLLFSVLVSAVLRWGHISSALCKTIRGHVPRNKLAFCRALVWFVFLRDINL